MPKAGGAATARLSLLFCWREGPVTFETSMLQQETLAFPTCQPSMLHATWWRRRGSAHPHFFKPQWNYRVLTFTVLKSSDQGEGRAAEVWGGPEASRHSAEKRGGAKRAPRAVSRDRMMTGGESGIRAERGGDQSQIPCIGCGLEKNSARVLFVRQEEQQFEISVRNRARALAPAPGRGAEAGWRRGGVRGGITQYSLPRRRQRCYVAESEGGWLAGRRLSHRCLVNSSKAYRGLLPGCFRAAGGRPRALACSHHQALELAVAGGGRGGGHDVVGHPRPRAARRAALHVEVHLAAKAGRQDVKKAVCGRQAGRRAAGGGQKRGTPVRSCGRASRPGQGAHRPCRAPRPAIARCTPATPAGSLPCTHAPGLSL